MSNLANSPERVLTIAGIGGQGIQVAGKTLARAAVHERKRALYFSLFDGAQRGGVSDACVALSTERIQAPPLMKQPCHALVAMDPNGLLRYEKLVKPGGVVIFNQSIHQVSRFRYADMHAEKVVDEAEPSRSDVDVLQIPATILAKERLDSPLMASLICVGALIARTQVVSVESAILGLRDSIRPGRHQFLESSSAALRLGADIALGRVSAQVAAATPA